MDIIYRYDPNEPIRDQACGDADFAEQVLREGNRRYASIVARVQAEFLGGNAGQPVVIPSSPLSMGFSLVPGEAPVQNPFALVLGCSDARAPIELIFDRSVNELFVVRVAGNVLGTEGLGSLEYAIRHLAGDLRLIVVLGHTGCGAVAAAVDLYLDPDAYRSIAVTYALRSIIDRLQVVVRTADKALQRRCGPTASAEPGYRAALWEMAIYLNAALTAYDLARELDLADEDAAVRVVYGVYDLGIQKVCATPRGEDAFARAPQSSEVFSALGDRLADTMMTCGILRPLEV